MLCRKELDDPRKCIAEGKAVTACALEFFRQVKKTCHAEFTQYATCLDKSSGDLSYKQWVKIDFNCQNIFKLFFVAAAPLKESTTNAC